MGAGRIIAIAASLTLLLPSPTQAGPGSPSGRLVYASDGSIFVSSADGAQRWRLTRSSSDAAPAWSPDGTKVAFLRIEEHGADLYAVSISGEGETKLATDVGDAFDWSPDGSSIAFTSAGNDLLSDTSHVFSVDVGSGLVEQLTRGPRSDTYPKWSPDGAAILFAGAKTGDLPRSRSDSDIYVYLVNGGRATALTKADGEDYAPEWSPEGDRIVFSSTRDTPDDAAEPAPEIYMMNAFGSNERRLTFRPVAHDVAPSWSPDGKRIVFLEYEGGAEEANGRVRMMWANGTRDRALTRTDELMTWDPSWGPDGNTIVFVASRIGDGGERSDTEVAFRYLSRPKIRFLTDNERFEWGPDWN